MENTQIVWWLKVNPPPRALRSYLRMYTLCSSRNYIILKFLFYRKFNCEYVAMHVCVCVCLSTLCVFLVVKCGIKVCMHIFHRQRIKTLRFALQQNRGLES